MRFKDNATQVHDNNKYARAQFREMYAIQKRIRDMTGQTVYWGGDFYMKPAHISSLYGSLFFYQNKEGDLCRDGRKRPTVGTTTRAIDYVFRTRPATCNRDAEVVTTTHSDHRLVGGYL